MRYSTGSSRPIPDSLTRVNPARPSERLLTAGAASGPRIAGKNRRRRTATLAAAVVVSLGTTALTATTLTATPFGSVVAPASAADTSEWLTDIPLSSDVSSPTIASGRLGDLAGADVAAGFPVTLYGWPSIEVLDAMRVGESVKLTPLAKALTASDGSFTLKIPDAAAAERLAGVDGLVDLEIQAWSPDGLASYSFTKQFDESTGSARLIDVAGEGEATTGLDLVTKSTAAAEGIPVDVGAVLNKTDVCGATKTRTYPSVDVVVGRMYSSTSGIRSSFSIKNNATATVGVAASVAGTYGEYSQSGTSTVKMHGSYSWDKSTLKGGRQFRTDFTYGRFSNWCYPVSAPSAKRVYSYTVRATRWEGGGSYGVEAVPSVKSTNCRPFASHSSQTKSSTKASSTSGGVKLSYVLAINLTSKAGYSSAASARIYNESSKQKKLCGTNGTPSSPGRFLAKA